MFNRMLAAALAAVALLSAPAWASSQGSENRLIVGMRPGVSAEQGRKMLAAQGLEVVQEIPEARIFLVKPQKGSAQLAFEALRADGKVQEVAKDEWRQWISPMGLTSSFPSVEEAQQQLLPGWRRPLPRRRWSRFNQAEQPWGVKRVNAEGAWAKGNEGAGVTVCVVDTGVDPNVPDLQGQVIDGSNFVEQGQSWHDDHFHGTHVAGTIAAKRDGKGVVGVAPKAKIIAAKVLSKEGGGNLFSIIQGVMWCGEKKAQVINMSLGAQQSIPFLEQIIDMQVNAGITVIAAAGNGDGKGGPAPVGYPAAYKNVIAISALDEQDGITKWSSRGPEVAFIAPGLKIPSTVPAHHDASMIKAYSGTSMACPHAAGLAALAIAKGVKGPAAVKAALARAAEKVPNLPATEQGLGVINGGKL